MPADIVSAPRLPATRVTFPIVPGMALPFQLQIGPGVNDQLAITVTPPVATTFSASGLTQQAPEHFHGELDLALPGRARDLAGGGR